jgi:O-antigen/teichoic acid export membrane protein
VTTAETETPSSVATPVATGLRDGAALGVAKLLAALLAVLALKALLRVTSEDDYGRYSAFLLVSNLAIAFTSWPAASVLRLGADEWVERRSLARTWALHVLLVLGAGALLAAPLWQAREEVDRYVAVHGAAWIILAYALVTALANVTAALLKPAARVGRFALLPLVTRVAYLGALAWLAHGQKLLGAKEVMLLCLATAAPQLLAGIAMVLPFVVPPRPPRRRDAETALGFGLPVLSRLLGAQGFAYVNLAVVKHFQGFVAGGRFNVAGQLAEQTALLGAAVEDLMGPILARSAAEGSDRVLATYYRTIAPQVALVWSTACGLLLLLAVPILAALSARNAESSGAALQILLLATAVRIIVTLEAPVFDAHLISGAPTVFFLLGFATNLGLDFLVVPSYGLSGAAWASVAGWSVNALLRTVYLGVRFRVPAPALFVFVLPAAAAYAYARLLGGRLATDLGAAIAFLAIALIAGKLAGVFSRSSLEALEGVRMPAKVRRFLGWFYGAER